MRPVDLISDPGYVIMATETGCRVTRKRGFGPDTRTMDLPVSAVRVAGWVQQGFGGPTIQDLFPELDADQREFLMSGNTPEDWKEMFG